MPRYKARIVHEVKDGSFRPGDITSTVTGKKSRLLDIELEADNPLRRLEYRPG